MKLYKRIRRKLHGAKVELRIYEDGTTRVRVDHPSNDPGTEIAIAGMLLMELRPRFEQAVGHPMKVGPVAWKDDPA